MPGNPRVFTNLTADQYLKLTRISIRDDRSISWLVSKAITDHIDAVEAYTGDATIKVMARTTPENIASVKGLGGTGWRWINAAVDRMLSDEQS
jgi:hypothetical protein